MTLGGSQQAGKTPAVVAVLGTPTLIVIRLETGSDIPGVARDRTLCCAQHARSYSIVKKDRENCGDAGGGVVA